MRELRLNMQKTDIRTKEYAADASLLFISVIWGSTFILSKQAIETIPTFAFLTLRFSTAFVILSFLCCIRRTGGMNLKILRDGVILGTALFLTFAFQTLGLRYTAASVAGFITGLYVVIVPLLSCFILKKRPHPFSVAGVILACTGLAMITLNGGPGFSKGEILVLFSAGFGSIHIVMTDTFSRKHDIFLLTTIQIGVIWFLSSAMSFGFDPFTLPRVWSPPLVRGVLLTGILATVVAFLVQTAAQKHTTPTKAAIIYCMEPLSSVFFSYFIGGEILGMKQYAGAVLIVGAMFTAEAGTWLRIRSKRRMARMEQEAFVP